MGHHDVGHQEHRITAPIRDTGQGGHDELTGERPGQVPLRAVPETNRALSIMRVGVSVVVRPTRSGAFGSRVSGAYIVSFFTIVLTV